MHTPERQAEVLEACRRSLARYPKRITVVENGEASELEVVRLGVGPLLTPHGVFHHFAFSLNDKWKKYSVLVKAQLTPHFTPIFTDPSSLLLRIDSGCETGQMFGDQTCECRDQLLLALKIIGERGEGLVIHIPGQDGRGLGLPYKLATLRVQAELGLDTVEASALLEPKGERDIRTYGGAVAILKFFGVPSGTRIDLATNNPKKLAAFSENGYDTSSMVPVVIPPTEHTRRHLAAKQEALGHVNLVTDK